MDATNMIQAKMMSGFSVSYGAETVVFSDGEDSKEAQLLAALLYYGEEGLDTSRLFDMLYYDEKDGDIVEIDELASRLRADLSNSALPKADYIIERNGVYFFEGPVPVESDTRKFRIMYDMAEGCDEEQRFGEFLAGCCALYGGELLPAWSQRRWVVYENASILDMYTDAVRQLCVYYQREEEYESIAGLCARASSFMPFDEEWHVNRINALIAMGDYRRALDEYESVTSMLFDEMGVYPSEKLMDCVRVISGRNIFSAIEDTDAMEKLEDSLSSGAYYCNYPVFIDGYKVMKRVMERDGVPSCLLLCTMTDGDGAPLEDHARLAVVAQMLRYALSRTLRKSDMYTRYSTSQILVMLWGTAPESAGLIESRIRALLDAQRQASIDAQVEFDILEDNSPYRLQAKTPQKKWKKLQSRAERSS